MKKIMVVDDETDQLFTIKSVIEDFSDEYEVITADSGAKCFELLKNNFVPDLILLDILMPEMNGWEIHKILRKESKWQKIPIIFLTAVDDKTSEITGRNIAEDFISKPIDKQDFKTRVEKVLKK
jgi:putative two-component system response regulator